MHSLNDLELVNENIIKEDISDDIENKTNDNINSDIEKESNDNDAICDNIYEFKKKINNLRADFRIFLIIY